MKLWRYLTSVIATAIRAGSLLRGDLKGFRKQFLWKKHLSVTDVSKQNKNNKKCKHLKLFSFYLRQREAKLCAWQFEIAFLLGMPF